jgi:hypothetical protein
LCDGEIEDLNGEQESGDFMAANLFLVCSIQLADGGFFSLVEGRNEEVQNEKVASHGANFSCIVAFQVAEVFPPLFEGEMKKSQVENKTMGFHEQKSSSMWQSKLQCKTPVIYLGLFFLNM